MAQSAVQQKQEFPDGGLGSFLTSNMDEVPDNVIAFGKPAGINSMSSVANKMAGLGRYEDDHVIHAATGEVVVPFELIQGTPGLEKTLRQKFQEAGVDYERYVVGNTLNSINPHTGMPEFFLKKLISGLKDIVKKVAPIVLPMVINFFAPGLGTIASGALGAGIGTLIQGGNFKDAMKSALIGGAIGGLSSGIGGMIKGGGFMSGVKGALPGAQGISAGTIRGTDAYNAQVSAAGAKPSIGASQQRSNVFKSSKGAPSEGQGSWKDWLVKPSPTTDAIGQRATEIMTANPGIYTGEMALQAATKELTPSLMSKYGNAALLGTAAAAAGGAFETPEPEKLDDPYRKLTAEEIQAVRVGVPGETRFVDANGVLVPTSSGQSNNPYGMLPDPSQAFNPYQQPMQPTFPQQGEQPVQYNRYGQPIAMAARGGEMNPNNFPRRNGYISGPGTGTSDSVPAMLSDGEFVMTANAVRNAGGGDRQQGVRKMYDIMRAFEGGVVA
jgi:hypothetical protein